MKRLIAFSLFFFSLFAVAEDATMVMINAGRNTGSLDIEASFTRLSPQAVEMGLRDVILIGRLKDENKPNSQEHDVEWHSITKNIDGTTKAKSLDSPLYSEKTLDDKGEEKSFDVGTQVLAKGDLNAMLTKFAELLAESEKSTEENTEIAMEEAASNSPLSSGALGSSASSQSPNLEEGDFEVKTDQYTMTYELCEPVIDSSLVATEMERSIKTSTVTNEILEKSACSPTGKTYKVFTESTELCEPTIDLNFVATELSKVVKRDENTGEILEESACTPTGKTYDTFKEEVRACDVFIDRDNNKVIEMSQTVKLDLETEEELTATACDFTDKSYPIEQDFELEECADLPNYIDAEYYKGYKEFYDLTGLGDDDDYVYISRCQTTLNDPTPIFQEISTCSPTENLTTNTTTINKKWYYVDEYTGQKEHVSECLESNETYPITETATTCSPIYDGSKVFTTTRKHWRDSTNTPHYVTDCRVSESSNGVQIQKEYSGELSHDWTGGASYEMSRDYYMNNGKKEYLTSDYSRDPSQSYTHKLTTSGCSATHDDTNLRSQQSQRTYINRKGATQYIKGCESKNGYMQYMPLGISTSPNNFINGSNTLGGSYGTAMAHYSASETCHSAKTNNPNYGIYYNSVRGNGGVLSEKRKWISTIRFFNEKNQYRRFDGSIYIASSSNICEANK